LNKGRRGSDEDFNLRDTGFDPMTGGQRGRETPLI
jgi:hypothetical protein